MPAEAWRTNLRAIWASQFIAMIGMSGVVPFLPLYVIELGVPEAEAPMWSGIIAAAPFVMAAMLTPLWGVLGDRYGQKSMVLRAVLGLGITVTLMGFAPTVQVLLVLRLLQGAASGFVASNNAFVSAQTPTDHVGYAMTTLQTSLSAGNIIGPLVGGSLGDAVGFRWAFILVGVLCLASFVIVLRMVQEDRSKHAGKPGRVRKNIALVLRDKGLRTLLLMLFIGQSAVVLTSPIFPFYLEELGAPQELLASLAGAAVSIVGVCTVFVAPWWGKRSDRIGYKKTMVMVTSIIALGMAAQAFVPWYGWIYPLRIVIGLAVGALLPLTYAELTRRAPEGRKGGIMGLASSATLLGNFSGPLFCSAIVSHVPVRYAFVAASFLMLAVHALSRRIPQRVPTALVVMILGSVIAAALPTGFSGRTTIASGGCGDCHGARATPGTVVTLLEQTTVIHMQPGERRTFTIRVAHPTAVVAGVNIAVATEEQGTHNGGVLSAQSTSGLRAIGRELVHQQPQGAGGGMADFSFAWTAPDTSGTFWIRAVGNAANGDHRNSSDDLWNWMQPVQITVGLVDDVAHFDNEHRDVWVRPLAEPAVLSIFSLTGELVASETRLPAQPPSPTQNRLPTGVYAVMLRLQYSSTMYRTVMYVEAP